MVVNLAAGLDARPYRMSLPASLQWIEVDLPEILAYKEKISRRKNQVVHWNEFDRTFLTAMDAERFSRTSIAAPIKSLSSPKACSSISAR